MPGSRMIGLILVVLALLALAGGTPAQAQHAGENTPALAPVVAPPDTPFDESRFAIDPSDPDVAGVAAATDRYHWTVGGDFHRRTSTLRSGFYACGVYALDPGLTNDEGAFTADLQLPDGAQILGVRLYVYNDDPAVSTLHITRYNGQGGVNNIVTTSIDAQYYTSRYVGLTTPYPVDNLTHALALVWYPGAYGGGGFGVQRLCGARVHYRLPAATTLAPAATLPPPATTDTDARLAPAGQASRYDFYAAATFRRRDSTTAIQYSGAGCIRSTTGGALNIDVDLPTGAEIQGVRMWYRDTSTTAGAALMLRAYDGAGSTTDIHTSSAPTGAPGAGTAYQALSTPYLVNQGQRAVVLTIILPADPTVEMCGLRIFSYVETTPSAATAPPDDPTSATDLALAAKHYGPRLADSPTVFRWIAGSTFQPVWTHDSTAYPGAGCLDMTGSQDRDLLFTALHLPDQAEVLLVRLFFYDSATNNSRLVVAESDGASGSTYLIDGDSSGAAGYGSTAFLPATPYVVDTMSRPLALLWDGANPATAHRLCGVRVMYQLPSVPSAAMPHDARR